MDALSLFGLASLTFMLMCYWLEDRNPIYVLGFALGCVLGSLYGFLQGAWPFGIVELIFAGVAIDRWRKRKPVP